MAEDATLSHTQDSFFQAQYDEKRVAMQKCQNDKQLGSCMPCDQLINCAIRDAFVQAVYQQMNKGQKGDFDFQ